MSGERRGPGVLLLDGRSGAGKSTLGGLLAERLGGARLRMDDLYPGWHGLRRGAELAVAQVLEPLARGEAARWRRWDWEASCYAEEHALEPSGWLVLEGCGAVTRASAPYGDLLCWLELDEARRLARARERDGDDSWWGLWREQEDALLAEERSPELVAEKAGLLLDGRLPAQELADAVLARLGAG